MLNNRVERYARKDVARRFKAGWSMERIAGHYESDLSWVEEMIREWLISHEKSSSEVRSEQ